MARILLSLTMIFGICGFAAAEDQPSKTPASQTSETEALLEDENPWGDWNKPASDNNYGVGLTGSDEQLLNTLDSSNLMDYDGEENQQSSENNGSRLTPDASSGNTVRRNEQDLQKEAEHFLIKSLEEKLLEDLSK